MKRRKQILSLLLSGIMGISMMAPSAVWGAEADVNVITTESESITYHTTAPLAADAGDESFAAGAPGSEEVPEVTEVVQSTPAAAESAPAPESTASVKESAPDSYPADSVPSKAESVATDSVSSGAGSAESGTNSGADSTSSWADSTSSGTDSTSSGTDSTSSWTDSTNSGTDSTSSGTDSTSSGTDSTNSGTDSTDSGTDSTNSGTDSTNSGTDSTDSGTDSTNSGTDSTDSGTDSTNSGTDSTDSGTDSTDSGNTDPKPGTHLLTILYLYEDGSEALPAGKGYYAEEGSYEVASPSLPGFKPDLETVSGVMGKEDVTVTVTYKEAKDDDDPDAGKEVILEIKYVNEAGTMVADLYVGTFTSGSTYRVESPKVSGYSTEETVLTGTISKNMTLTVVYKAEATPVPTPSPAEDRTYYPATYFMPVKIENPELKGYVQVSKRYAYADTLSYVNVREEMKKGSRIVGVLYPENICYVLSDVDKDWLYVESGQVRGFVERSRLVTGDEAEAYITEKGEAKFDLATLKIEPKDNKAFRYTLTTVRNVPSAYYGTLTNTADRNAMIQYASQFLGNPYVWGGEDLIHGTDCSGFTQQIYGAFGIGLPRCSYEQAEAGVKIDPQEALPGDLLFYARGGVVYHVMIYIGNGQVIHASSSTTGIIISNVDYSKVPWACRFIADGPASSTQVTDLMETGKKAYNGDPEAQQTIIEAIARATKREWRQYGFLPSVLIAQVIQESGWVSMGGAAKGGIQPEDNNVLGMNAELRNDEWTSPWTGLYAARLVPQWNGTQNVYGEETMRIYPDIEACLADYAAFKIGIHPEIANVTDVDTVIAIGLKGYATDPTYQQSIKSIVERYDLTKYDKPPVEGDYRTDDSAYTQEQIELIWALVAQEDDTSYEGALAVISSVMNRADVNYGGYGQTAIEQLTADGQYCYSPKISAPELWQRRLNGNVSDFVKEAVEDCLVNGIRNTPFLNFRSTDRTGSSVNIGSNWFF